MKLISKLELTYALTQHYQNYKDDPADFGEPSDPFKDATLVANTLFSFIEAAND